METAAREPARRTKPKTTAGLHELLQRIEAEYREMPGLSVTARQAERLWGLDSTTCAFVLMTLIQRGLLKRTASGTYVRG
jgi:predicted transcriptional regulator of viral defense system